MFASMLAACLNSALSKHSFAWDLRHFFLVLRELGLLVEVRDCAVAGLQSLRDDASEESVAVDLALHLHFFLGNRLGSLQPSGVHEAADVFCFDEQFSVQLFGLVWVPVLVCRDEAGLVVLGEPRLLCGECRFGRGVCGSGLLLHVHLLGADGAFGGFESEVVCGGLRGEGAFGSQV